MDVARLLVQVEANTMQAEAGLASLHKSVALAAIGFGVLAVAGGVAGIAAVKMAGDFEQGIKGLVTGAGLAAGDIGLVGDRIKTMAVDTGESTKQLIAGMFMISSAGYNTADSLKILRASAEGARAEQADLGTVTNAVTTVMRDYPHAVNSAVGAVNTLIATVENGKTHLQDLAGALATVLPGASVARIGLNDVMGAMAAMTARGVGADQAATYLRMTILSLMAPGAGARKALAEIGLTSTEVALEMQKSMPAALDMIYEGLKKTYKEGSPQFIAALKEIAGGAKTSQGMMLLAGQGTDFFAEKVKDITKRVKEGGAGVMNWSLVQGEFNFKMAQAREMLETAFITIGEHLLPILTKVVGFIVDNAMPAVKNLTKIWEDNKATIIIVAALIAGALTAAFLVWAAAAAAAAFNTLIAIAPILAIGAAIGLLVAGVIYAYTHWGWFRKAVDVAREGLGYLADIVRGVITFIGNMSQGIDNLIGKLERLNAAGKGVLGGLGQGLRAAGIPMPGFAEGTQYASGGSFIGAERGPELLLTPGIYSAPRGSTVLSAEDTAKVMGAAGGGGSVTYNIYPEKSMFDAQEMDRLQRRRALLGSRAGGFS